MLPDSHGGLRASPYHSDEFGTQYQIRSHNAWTAGLFALHEDSWLHIRFRAEKFKFFHVLLVARRCVPSYERWCCALREITPVGAINGLSAS